MTEKTKYAVVLGIVLITAVCAFVVVFRDNSITGAGKSNTSFEKLIEQDWVSSPAESGAANGKLASVQDPKDLWLSRIYSANSITELYALNGEVTGELAVDLAERIDHVRAFCNSLTSISEYGGNSFLDWSAVLSKGLSLSEPSKEIERSGEYIDFIRPRFCTEEVDLFVPFSSEISMVETALEQTGVNALLHMASESYDSEVELNDARDRLIDFMATTASPVAFFRAAEHLVADTPISQGWQLPGYRSHPADFGPDRPKIGFVALQLAYCRLAPMACRGNGITVINQCVPSNCRPNESLQEFLQRTHSADVMTAAEAYANALLRLRQERRS
jgi:hypothetical protein